MYTFYCNRGIYLTLRVTDNLTQVIACHCKGITIAIAELGAANLCVCHTLIVQMSNLEGDQKRKTVSILLNM